MLSDLPTILGLKMADYKKDIKGYMLPVIIGQGNYGNVTLDLFAEPNIVITGNSLMGKTELLKNIIVTLIEDESPIDLYICNYKPYELFVFRDSPSVKGAAYSEETMKDTLDHLLSEVFRRYEFIAKNASNTLRDLIGTHTLKPIVLIIDELLFLSESKQMINQISKLNTLGKGCFVYTILASQRQDVFSRSVVNNSQTIISFRLLSGSSNSPVYIDGSTTLGHPGRCLVKKQSGDTLVVQVPMVTQTYIDSIL